ncbi:N-acetyltransferase [Ktedonosporobacter rubrisoli]|uniref:N-acetyltransferase n=1 Tax=Ktedonosporobacter rubrisoli TaxID=2509675 RepID=A0A4P6JJL1_KTERU|nr:GNAT family N-acetyltransferase [Ktedonosporobacter rubrisoli]QBD75122.1 N-acetyltransferase [Ktedonosporobacter rubrisoli]
MSLPGNQEKDRADANIVHLELWDEGDLALLKKLMGDPAMTEHLGGPENDEQLAERHARYLRLVDKGRDRMFKIVHTATGEAVGSIGYWERSWHDQQVYEMGWSVLPACQGKGIASLAAAQIVARLRSVGVHRFVHAFPSVDNPPSNALCRKLGFTLLGACKFEYPKGHFMQCNDWRFELSIDAKEQ